MSILKKGLIKISGNHLIQRALEKNIQVSQSLMGIGSGANASLSGEQAVFNLLKQKCQPPYCIFDVGSNKGQFLQLILDNIRADAFQIHCFEPGHETFKILCDSFKEIPQVKLNNLAIGKESGKTLLYFDNPGSALASLTRRNLEHFGIIFSKSEEIQVNTIDDYCQENLIDYIHLLKLDIEGHELDALSGAKRMFDQRLVDIVTFEFGGCNIDTRTFLQDFWYFFHSTDMRIFRITPSGYLHPIDSYREIYEQFRTTNYVAISNSQ